MGKENEFDRMLRKANKKGWSVPNENNSFDDGVWLRYWQGMEAYSQGRCTGRPVPPHRSGGGQRF